MASPKAKYSGEHDALRARPFGDFSDSLRQTLRAFSPSPEAADRFVEAVLVEARWALGEMYWQTQEINRQEMRAEAADLGKVLADAEEKLRSLSSDFDRLLGVDADPLGTADNIAALRRQVEQGGAQIKKLPRSQTLLDRQHDVAVGMAVRVGSALLHFGVDVTGSGGAYFNDLSPAARVFKAIGDDIGLRYADTTWRDTASKAARLMRRNLICTLLTRLAARARTV